MYLGSWKINDVLKFGANLHHPTGASAVDHDAGGSPLFRVYEDNASPDIASGFMYQLHGACTIGFYSGCVTLSAANGYEQGKHYFIYMAASVASTTGTMHHTFQVGAEVRSACIAASAVNASALAANAIHAAGIASSAFTNAAFGNNFLTNSLINASSITASTLAANSIHAAAINASSISACKIAANSLDSSHIAACTLVSTQIADSFGQRLADHTLRRSGSGVENSGFGDGLHFRSLYGAVAKQVNRLDASSGTAASVFQTNDSTSLGSQTITACDNASPIVQLNTD